jgi:hypothetical protein
MKLTDIRLGRHTAGRSTCSTPDFHTHLTLHATGESAFFGVFSEVMKQLLSSLSEPHLLAVTLILTTQPAAHNYDNTTLLYPTLVT